MISETARSAGYTADHIISPLGLKFDAHLRTLVETGNQVLQDGSSDGQRPDDFSNLRQNYKDTLIASLYENKFFFYPSFLNTHPTPKEVTALEGRFLTHVIRSIGDRPIVDIQLQAQPTPSLLLEHELEEARLRKGRKPLLFVHAEDMEQQTLDPRFDEQLWACRQQGWFILLQKGHPSVDGLTKSTIMARNESLKQVFP